jgi:hypothetical protein
VRDLRIAAIEIDRAQAPYGGEQRQPCGVASELVAESPVEETGVPAALTPATPRIGADVFPGPEM